MNIQNAFAALQAKRNEADEHESDSEDEDVKWLDELLLENGVQGAMGVPADEPPGETPTGAFAYPLLSSGLTKTTARTSRQGRSKPKKKSNHADADISTDDMDAIFQESLDWSNRNYDQPDHLASAHAASSGKTRQKGLYGDFQPVQGDHLPRSNIQPRMPHLEYSAEDLERHYPSLEPPDDLELDDLSRLEDDLLYNAGMPVVQQILDEMAVSGRTRKAHSERVVSSVESSHTVLPSTFSKQPRQDCHPSSRRSVRFDGTNRTVDGFTSRPFCGLAQVIFRD